MWLTVAFHTECNAISSLKLRFWDKRLPKNVMSRKTVLAITDDTPVAVTQADEATP
jgi:hypothetical protein